MAWHHIKQTLSTSVTILLLGLSLTAVYALSQGTKFLSVQSGSMVPAFSKGDLVIVNRAPDHQYKVGDVITFINPANNKQTITHRVNRVIQRDNMQPQRYVTKGDANIAADSPIGDKNIVGKVNFAIPYLGFAFDFVRKPIGLLLAIYIPALTIVAAEMRRLIKHYKSQEPYVATGYDPNKPVMPKPSQSKRVAKAGAVAMIAAVGVAVPSVHAALMSTATLTNSSISTAPASLDHLVISKVTFDSSGGSSSSTTNINVTNNSNQTATSGNATGNGATSGDASNTSNTSININIGNNGSSGGNTPATVTIYNPTNATINLSGWTLADNNSTQTLPNDTSVTAKGSYTFAWPATGGLERAGDRLVLGSPFTANIDALSWGNDPSQLNPAVITTANTTTLQRNDPGADTNTATDWQAS